jgi:hypothetical protein
VSPTTCHVIDLYANVRKVNTTSDQANDSGESPGPKENMAQDTADCDRQPDVLGLPI